MNYYHPKRVQAPESSETFNGKWMPDKYFSDYEWKERRVNPYRGWEIYPKAIYDIAKNIQDNYHNIPWFISENGMGVEGEERFIDSQGMIQDDYRIEFYEEHLLWLHKAIEEGSNCFGYHTWTAFDCWSWNNAYKNRYGFISVDLATQKRTIKKSGYWYKEVSNKNLSLVAKEIFPYWIFVIFIIGGAVFAIATSMITAITMVRYPILKVAEDGWLPKICKKTTSSGYPWVVYLIFYIVSIVPVLLGFSLDVIVSLVMIPYMITNIYCNLACIRIINKYPKQWENSILHMPKILIDIICILAALSALIVCYNLFILLDKSQMLLMLGILFLMSIFSIISIKTGNVSIENLEKNKEIIIQEALNEED